MVRKERIIELDVLRGLAFLAVVYQHIIGIYIRKSDIVLFDGVMIGMVFNLMKFAVPTFVFITALALFYNYYEKVHYLKFVKKRLVDIFIPYVCWTFIYFFYIHHSQIAFLEFTWIKAIARELVIPVTGYHLWYIVLIFQFYLLFPLILIAFKWFYKHMSLIWIISISAVVYLFLMWLSSDYLLKHPTGYTYVIDKLVKFRSLNGLMYFFYFVMGIGVALTFHKWKEFVTKSLTLNLILFILLYIWVGYELVAGSAGAVNLNYSTSLKPSMFVFTVCHILLLYAFSIQISEMKNYAFKLLSFVGKYSFGAYLAHALIISLVIRTLNYLGINMSFNYLTQSFVIFIVVSIISVVFTYYLTKIPFARILTGSLKSPVKKESFEADKTVENKESKRKHRQRDDQGKNIQM